MTIKDYTLILLYKLMIMKRYTRVSRRDNFFYSTEFKLTDSPVSIEAECQLSTGRWFYYIHILGFSKMTVTDRKTFFSHLNDLMDNKMNQSKFAYKFL